MENRKELFDKRYIALKKKQVQKTVFMGLEYQSPSHPLDDGPSNTKF